LLFNHKDTKGHEGNPALREPRSSKSFSR